MNRFIAHVSLVIDDYDEAVQFYTQKLNFELVEDTPLSEEKRWAIVSPKKGTGCDLLLAKAANEEQREHIGNQTGGRVFLFLYTDDFWRDYNNMLEQEIKFVRPPKVEDYGTVAVFEDLYGNLWDLIEPKTK